MTGKIFLDAGEALGTGPRLARAIAAAIEAEGLEVSAIHASAVGREANPNAFLLAVDCSPGDGLRLTLRIGTRLGGNDLIRAQMIERRRPDGEPFTLLVFLDAPIAVRRDH